MIIMIVIENPDKILLFLFLGKYNRQNQSENFKFARKISILPYSPIDNAEKFSLTN